MRRLTTDEADIENVNPQAVAAKRVNLAGAPSALGPSVSAAAASVPNQALSKTSPLSGPSQLPSATAPAPAAGTKPFVSSKVLSEALFGTDDPQAASTAVRTPVSPFAEASTAAPLSGIGGSAKSGAGAPRLGAVATSTALEGVGSGGQRLDGTPRGSGNAERVEEALMGTSSPFSRPLSSDELKPVLARQSQPGSAAAIQEEEQPQAVPQLVGGSRVAAEAARAQGSRPGAVGKLLT